MDVPLRYCTTLFSCVNMTFTTTAGVFGDHIGDGGVAMSGQVEVVDSQVREPTINCIL